MKKVLAIILAVVSIISCFGVVVNASATTSLEPTNIKIDVSVDGGFVDVVFSVDDINMFEGFSGYVCFGTVLEMEGDIENAVTDGEYKSQMTSIGCDVFSQYWLDEPGLIGVNICVSTDGSNNERCNATCDSVLFRIRFKSLTDWVEHSYIYCMNSRFQRIGEYVDIYINDPPVCCGKNMELVDEEVVRSILYCCDRGEKEYTYKCLTCGNEKRIKDFYRFSEEDLTSNPLIHKDCHTTVYSPTCVTRGYTFFCCHECGYAGEYDYAETIPHVIVLANVKASTYESTGYTGDSYCLICHQLLEKGKEIPILQKEETTTEKEEAISTEETTEPTVKESEEKTTFSIKNYIEKIISKIREFFKGLF